MTFISMYISELNDFKERRVEAFKKNLMELAELEIKHAEVRKTTLYGIRNFVPIMFENLTSIVVAY